MLSNYMGVLDLNENEQNIKSLTHSRPLASIPIGGRYRIIDFALSNLVNSGITNIGIFTQNNSRSLEDHLGTGKPWDLDRKINGLFVFSYGVGNTYLSDLDIMKNNIEYFYNSRQEYIILSSSYMICNVDFEKAASFYEKSGADITIIYKKVSNCTKNFLGCDVLNIDKTGRVMSVGKNIGIASSCNISMEMFIMKKEVFLNLIYSCVKTGYSKNLKEAIYKNLNEYSINSYEFEGYARCVNSINSYYKTNMDMLQLRVSNELFFRNGLIYTKVKDEPPTEYTVNSQVSNALIANGCLIDGKIENSIIFRRVDIGKGSVVKNCIIMQGCHIKDRVKISNVIIDKNVTIESGKELKGDSEFPLVIEKRQNIFNDF